MPFVGQYEFEHQLEVEEIVKLRNHRMTIQNAHTSPFIHSDPKSNRSIAKKQPQRTEEDDKHHNWDEDTPVKGYENSNKTLPHYAMHIPIANPAKQ